MAGLIRGAVEAPAANLPASPAMRVREAAASATRIPPAPLVHYWIFRMRLLLSSPT